MCCRVGQYVSLELLLFSGFGVGFFFGGGGGVYGRGGVLLFFLEVSYWLAIIC